MLAAYLVWSKHLDSISAISVVRRERRYSVETKVQEESVAAFHETLKQTKLN